MRFVGHHSLGAEIFNTTSRKYPRFLPRERRLPSELELQLRGPAAAAGEYDAQQGGGPAEGRGAPLQLRHGAAHPARHRVRRLCHRGEEKFIRIFRKYKVTRRKVLKVANEVS